jgi:hypothetical protein
MWTVLITLTGRFSPKVDEWCFTFATQTVSGRIHERESNCRTLCIRKVFPHEVRNIISFKRHSKVDEEGKAVYPLPAEGQPVNLPRLLGGKVPEETDDGEQLHPSPARPSETKNWQEGWYLWTSGSRKAALERLQLMSFDLEKQERYQQHQEQRQELWEEYQDKLRQGGDKELLAQQYSERGTMLIRPPLVSEADR